MHCTVMSCTLQRYTVTGLLTALAIFRLAAGSARAQQPDATTISVAVAQANAHCLIKTGAMKPEKAQSIADGFLAKKKISPQTRNAVQNSDDFNDLMTTSIADRGGCSALVDDLRR